MQQHTKQQRIEALVQDYNRRLSNVKICANRRARGGRQCDSSSWTEVVATWRARALEAERARLTHHWAMFGEIMPESSLTMFSERRWKPLVPFEPEYSCGENASRFPYQGDLVGSEVRHNQSSVRRAGGRRCDPRRGKPCAQPDDGAKWLCGLPQTRVRHGKTPSCVALSVGSNFADAFERELSAATNCTSYILDPTLGRVGSPAVQAFQARLAGYGAHLNASVGLGHGLIRARDGDGPNPLVSFREVLRGSGRLFCANPRCDRWHIPLAKIDAEGGEFVGLADPEHGAWRLCVDGLLTIDQLTVEVHPRKVGSKTQGVSASAVHALFAGAVECSLMLHHKEINWRGCHAGNCAEFSWVSVGHALRVALGSARTMTKGLA